MNPASHHLGRRTSPDGVVLAVGKDHAGRQWSVQDVKDAATPTVWIGAPTGHALLTQDMVAALIPYLASFLTNGTIDAPVVDGSLRPLDVRARQVAAALMEAADAAASHIASLNVGVSDPNDPANWRDDKAFEAHDRLVTAVADGDRLGLRRRVMNTQCCQSCRAFRNLKSPRADQPAVEQEGGRPTTGYCAAHPPADRSGHLGADERSPSTWKSVHESQWCAEWRHIASTSIHW